MKSVVMLTALLLSTSVLADKDKKEAGQQVSTKIPQEQHKTGKK